ARRSGLVSTEVTVTKPMRGSLNSVAIVAPTTSRSTSLMRRMREVAILLVQCLLDLLGPVELEHVFLLDVRVALEDDAALLTLLDLLHVVFESAQGVELAVPDHGALADQAHAGVARDLALGDHAAGDSADFRRFEGLFDLG